MDKMFISKIREMNKRIACQDDYEIIENLLFPDAIKCRVCGKSIYYYNSFFRYTLKHIFVRVNKSCESKWTINNIDYPLTICEHCLQEAYPEYATYNKGRVFNTLNKITKFAYEIPDNIADEYNKSTAITLKNCIKRYGEEVGTIKFNEYRKKCSDTNKYEHKLHKYGWTEEEFANFNKSRSITLKNCIKRYGEEVGTIKFNEYRDVQRMNGNKVEWFISKYGEEIGLQKYADVNKRKGQTLENYIVRHGEEQGTLKFNEYMQRRMNTNNYSKKSQILFAEIELELKKRGYNLTLYYASKNNEIGKNLPDIGYVYLDFFIKELNLCIEYNGDIWHANPKKYISTDTPNFYNKSITAGDIWKKDELRYKKLKDIYNIDTIVVWESDKTYLHKVIKIIESYIYKKDN